MWRTSNSYCIAFLVISYNIQMLSISLKKLNFPFRISISVNNDSKCRLCLGPPLCDQWSWSLIVWIVTGLNMSGLLRWPFPSTETRSPVVHANVVVVFIVFAFFVFPPRRCFLRRHLFVSFYWSGVNGFW